MLNKNSVSLQNDKNLSDSETEEESLFDINNIKDLINIATNYNKKYKGNPDVEKLWKIRASLRKLDKMVGLESLKKDIMNQIIFICQGLNKDEMMHTALMGPPGVGKTTVAKIIGEIYTKLGNLSKGTFRIVGRDELVAEYLGQTAIKTKKVLQASLGGVLFIDEAYSLGNDASKDTYSKECIDTITKFLSEHTKDFVCIIAGYTDQLQRQFFDSNPGLDRRFPWKYTLESYKSNELTNIFQYQLFRDKWRFKKLHYLSVLEKEIHENKELFTNNGGDTDNLISSCKIVHAKRMFGKPKTWKRYITKKDIKNGVIMFKKHRQHKLDHESIIRHMFI